MSENGTLERLVTDLGSSDLLARIEATQALGRLGDRRAVEPLIAALDDPGWRASLAAARALGELGDVRAVEPITRLLQRRDAQESLLARSAEYADAVVFALRKLGEPGFQALLDVAREFAGCEFPGVAAARVLGEMRDVRALDALCYAACSYVPGYTSWPSADAAADALSSFGEVAIPMLIAALRDEEAYPYTQFRRALQRIGRAAIPPLLEALEEADDPDVREQVIAALGGYHDDERVVESLKRALDDENSDVRQAAAVGLAERGDPSGVEQLLTTPVHVIGASAVADVLARIGESAVEPLLRALMDDQRARDARVNAAAALGRIGDACALEPLRAALRDHDPYVRRAAARGLGNLNDRRAVGPLLAALQDNDADVRANAARALGVFGDDRAIPPLAALAMDEEEHVRARQSAVLALGSGYGDRAVPVLRDVITRDYTGNFNGGIVMEFTLGHAPAPLVIEVLAGTETWPKHFRLDRSRLHLRFTLLSRLQAKLQADDDPRIRDFLVAALGHREPGIRHRAAVALGSVRDERALDMLIETLTDDDFRVRWQAALHLADMGDERALPALEEAYAEVRGARWWNWDELNIRDAVQGAILAIRTRLRRGERTADSTRSGASPDCVTGTQGSGRQA